MVFASAWLLCAAGPGGRKEVSLCADLWCPFNCEPDSQQQGFAVEIVRDVFARAGYTVSYQTAAWPRCVEDSRAGRFTAIIGAIRADAPDFTFPKIPIGSSRAGYAVRKGDLFHYSGPRDFDGRVIATVSDYGFGGETGAYLAAHLGDKTIELAFGNNAIEKNLAKLLAGRVDLVVDDSNVLRNKIDALGMQDKLTVSEGPFSSPLFIAFSPASPDREQLARILDNGIARLRASGALAAILARYHVRGGS
jgi:polar amino acid transport system substrate-binding protein